MAKCWCSWAGLECAPLIWDVDGHVDELLPRNPETQGQRPRSDVDHARQYGRRSQGLACRSAPYRLPRPGRRLPGQKLPRQAEDDAKWLAGELPTWTMTIPRSATGRRGSWKRSGKAGAGGAAEGAEGRGPAVRRGALAALTTSWRSRQGEVRRRRSAVHARRRGPGVHRYPQGPQGHRRAGEGGRLPLTRRQGSGGPAGETAEPKARANGRNRRSARGNGPSGRCAAITCE